MDGFSRRPLKKMPAPAVDKKTARLVYSENVQLPPQRITNISVKKQKRRRFIIGKKASGVKKPYKTPESIHIRIPRFVRRFIDVYMGLPFLLRVFSIVMVLLLLLVIGFEVYYSKDKQEVYVLGNANLLLKDPVDILGDSLQLSGDGKSYQYNKDYQPATEVVGDAAIPKFTADFAMDPAEGVTITDVVNKVSIGLKPKFPMMEPQKDQNRLIYPMKHNSAKKVYTLGTSVIKEDILLNKFIRSDMTFEYDLELPDYTEARLEQNGSIGIYGPENRLLMGEVSTGTEQDAELLEKARQNADKETLLFNIPAPFVVEPGKKVSTAATAKYELSGKSLKLIVTGLDKATYPLSIDPSVYIETAAQLMRGNNETNIDFDVDKELIQKSQTTGARIDEWSSTTNLSNAVWGQGTAVAGGYIYSVGGVGSGNTITTTYDTAGTSTYTVPTGVTSITVKAWGAGGGGGAGNGGSGLGGNGGGGGYAKAVINVTPGEGLTVRVGAGGAKATANGRGGSGGEASKINRSSTILLEAGAGGGGAGRRGSTGGTLGHAGAGGGATGQAGATGTGGTAAGGGTQTTGGSAGSGTAAGRAGVSQGGGGGSPIATSCSTVAASGNGSSGTGGTGGTYTTTCAPGGGGGGGYFGGGGGASTSTASRTGGGGGGGSSYANASAIVSGTDVLTVGALNVPGNNGDSDRGGLGDGGNGAATAAAATAGDNGIITISYTAPGTVSNAVYWAKFNTTNNSIESPNPGTGACGGWCNNSAYNLPTAGLKDLSLVAYNGYLYAIGGATSAGAPQSTVYIAKLGANGEPQLWHPTGGTQVYWYQDTSLGNARSKFAAVAYNNRIYVLGGLNTSTTVLGSDTVQSASINPMGTLGAWTSTGMQQLSSSSAGNRYGLTAHVYNNALYIVGGDATLSGTPVANVDYSKLNADGTMNSWVQTSSLGSGRLTAGGSYSTVFGAYMYVAGGCSVVDANGYCTTIATDVQIASINADGTLDSWSVISGLTNDRFAHTLIAWQGGLYRLGGCRAQDTGSGACTDTAFDVDYGVINPAGEVSTVNITEPSGTLPCTGTAPLNCDLPPTGDNAGQGGQMLSSTVVLNGYLYVIGGCTNYDCSNSSGNTSYVAIGSDGSLQKPSICSGTSYGAWCVDNTNRVNGTSGVSAAGVTTFNNRIYIVGGIDETATGAQEIFYNSTNADGSLGGAWGITTFATAGISGELGYTYTFARANPSSAGTNPGNLYILGGCSALSASAGCSSSYNTQVYKCNIATNGSVNGCSINNQLQLDTELATETNQGLGLHSGTVYANYIYLIGGYSDNVGDRNTIFYAKIDDNNNIVDAESGTAILANNDDDWIESTNTLSVGRRRGWAFGYNGHIYAVGGYDASGTGIIPFIEWSKMNVSNGQIDPFVTSSVTINQRWGLSMVVNNSYAYVIGGCDVGISPGGCSSFEASVQTFQLYNNNSGSIANFTNQSDQTFSADTDRWGANSAVLNGYLYVAGGCISVTDCTNATNSVQYAPISAVDGSIGTWAPGGNLPADRTWGSLEAAGGTLYYVGGQDDAGTAQTTVYYTSGISSGNPTWTGTAASNGLPSARTRFGSTVWDDRIYVVGGVGSGGTCTGTVCDTVYISPKLSSGGNITSAWATSTAFNVDRSGLAVTSYANNLYIFGGHDGTNYLSDVQFASLGYKTGTISQAGTTVTGSGTTFNSSMVGSTIQYTADGSKATITGYTDATHITVDASKTVNTGSAYTIQDGSVGTWSYTKSLPGPLRDARAISANGYIYLVGGRSANASCLPKILVSPISANTTILSGNNPTGVGEWYETNVRYGGGRYGVAAEYINGKIYTMGGGCTSPIGPNYTTGTITQSGTTVTAGGGASWTDNYVGATLTYADASTAKVISVSAAGTSMTVSVSKTIGSAQSYTLSNVRHYHSTLNSQPQVAIYSRMIDTDTDVFPTKWLMNGLDNSIGARWQLSYQSMHDTNSTSDTVNGVLQQNPYEDCGTSTTMPVMTTWGQITNVGDVTLGTPGNYTPLNGSGGTINCARYYYFKVSIDASKTFGYPEDVNRGPTISDLSLYYTADPSKRMRHGKTFTGGEQQPLDTPF